MVMTIVNGDDDNEIVITKINAFHEDNDDASRNDQAHEDDDNYDKVI